MTFDLKGKNLIGMVHCLPLPKTPYFADNCDQIISQAIQDAKALENAGFDAICIENMNDTPLKPFMDIPQIAALSAVAALVRESVSLPIGIDAAFNDYKASLSIAKILDADFIRTPVFVDTVVYFGGTIQPSAPDCMRYREELKGSNIKILADVQVKHSHMLVPSIPLVESAKMAVDCGADGLIITGAASGHATPIESLEDVKKNVEIPVFVGSGVKTENIKDQMNIADGAFIGSSIKKDGLLMNPIDSVLANQLIAAYKG